MKIGVIADDFTGASDIALTLAEAGMKTLLLAGLPEHPVTGCDAAVISLKSRTAPLEQAIRQSLQACDWLTGQGAEQIIFKVCSTFDSTDQGNIGQVTEALAERLGETAVIVCPAFPENGRSVYQGHLFVGDRLLSESGMQNHPLTPMRESDLRRVLARQTRWPVAHVPAQVVARGTGAVAEMLTSGKAMFIVDAIEDDDLVTIGAAAKHRKLLCGGSGIALGLPGNFGFRSASPPWTGHPGKGAVLSGSCSVATRAQIAAYSKVAPSLELTADAVMAGKHSAESVADWVMAEAHKAPLVYSSADPETVKAAQQKYGQTIVADRIEGLFRELAAELSRRGISQIVSAGGETSGAVVAGLGARQLTVGTRIAPGVPALRVDDRALVIALKSGNFGDENFFAHAIKMLSEDR
ncbi:four-carbon acid sugar kinase family protein [Hoeflea sp. YIM 152468]|uniref:3-oxo-tetronate kinase n=1 Tax=Hoeflea sp. YIM 152468 TaxID=3031759 RepID=UPI0023DAD80F|nr:3-oxo-tetronate kinase [Hoeflea sp. YIM 152468]MDF1610199.1 four-carbon acid sugar kinase family protein [Hoeflea sp. YIM 152468]